jgi:thymidylate kinase
MPEEDALRKKNIKEFGESRKLLDFLIKSYREESFRIKSLMEKNPDTVILLDRCFVTPAAIRYATRNDVSNWNPDWFERICENWEDGVLKPDLIFTIRVDEKLRAKRMRERAEEKGEEINEREKRLLSDDDYREDTLDAELKLGCIPLRIREKDPEVVALRALQMLLGDKRYEHRRRD